MDFENVSEALPDLTRHILDDGEKVPTRQGGYTYEVTDNVVTLLNPARRHLTVQNRFNNPIAAIVETLWVLNGQNDIDTISPYLPRAAQFSDDGETWRAGYGPRIRSWHGVDQVKQVIETLSNDPTSRRAAISIFDPEFDHFQDTVDIPCNNMLYFRIRDGRLDMSVCVRSNDIVWGWSGVNTFEWSVLQQYIADALGVHMGTQTWFQGSLHIYDTYAEKFLKNPYRYDSSQTGDLGNLKPGFNLFTNDLSNALERFKDWEAGEDASANDFVDVNLLTCFSLAVYSYWRIVYEDFGAYDYFCSWCQKFNLEDTDFYESVQSYLYRTMKKVQKNLYNNIMQPVIEIHTAKEKVYKGSWCKHGESGIKGNIWRKSDRLAAYASLSEEEREESYSVEALEDTLQDLMVYLVKYHVWLTDNHYDGVDKVNDQLRVLATHGGYLGDLDLDSHLKSISIKCDNLETTSSALIVWDIAIHVWQVLLSIGDVK